ncbi:MAG: YbaY family lipoprotein [Caldilineaceae bacterium]
MNTTEPQDKRLISGEISFEATSNAVAGATVYVRLEDVSRLDAAAILVAETLLPAVALRGQGQDRLHFTLEAALPDPKAHYSLRVHVDVDGDGQISRGDYITMESYPVRPSEAPQPLAIRVREVRARCRCGLRGMVDGGQLTGDS